MKKIVAAAAASGLMVLVAQAQAGAEAGSGAEPVAARLSPDWSEWTRPLRPSASTQEPIRAVAQQPILAADSVAEEEIDVVDAHWMALTMWGEARGQGETGMRAVGHVIRNRKEGKRHGAYVTDTVSAAWQFSCWNPGDPNRVAMLAVEDLPRDSEGYRLWRTARRLADEILSGRSADPTGGALFYHAVTARPKWSEGVTPVTRIGEHLFYLSAR